MAEIKIANIKRQYAFTDWLYACKTAVLYLAPPKGNGDGFPSPL